MRRPGMVLIVVLVVIAALSLSGYALVEWMLVEQRAAAAQARLAQSRLAAESGLVLAESLLLKDPATREDQGGVFDNPTLFRGQLVVDDPAAAGRARFTLVAPLVDEGYYAGLRYGLEDESSKLNLNLLAAIEEQQPGIGRELLMSLPGMTEDVADAILDWLDEDDEPRDLGAEAEEYTALAPPYEPKNGPLDTLDELLLVRGVTPALLYGVDADRSGVVDEAEAVRSAELGLDLYDGQLDRGWAAYLTLYSAEANTSVEGEPRVFVNGTDDLEALFGELETAVGREWATFLIAYRQEGPYTGSEASQPASTVAGRTLDYSREARYPLQTTLDLIGVKVEARFLGSDEPTIIESPFMTVPAEGLAELVDQLTVNDADLIPGRVNVNQASRVALLTVPGMTEELVDAILSVREAEPLSDDATRNHETWLLTEGLVELDQMKQLLPFVTTRGGVYRAQVVGYFEQTGTATRIEAVLDATGPEPRQLLWRDLTHLGRGFPLGTLGETAPVP